MYDTATTYSHALYAGAHLIERYRHDFYICVQHSSFLFPSPL